MINLVRTVGKLHMLSQPTASNNKWLMAGVCCAANSVGMALHVDEL